MTDPTTPPVLSPLLTEAERRCIEDFADLYSESDEGDEAKIANALLSMLAELDAQRATVARLREQLTAHDKEQASDIIQLVRQIETERGKHEETNNGQT